MLTGSCLCGAVAFEISGKLGPAVYCHCSQCRRANGSAFAANADVRAKYLEFTRGRDLIHEYESTPGKFRAFCSRCGSPMYSRRPAQPEILRIRLGTLDADPGRRPLLHGHAASKAPWHEISDALPRFPDAIPALSQAPGRLLGVATRSGKRVPMRELDAADVTTASGVANDPRGTPGPRQVTVMAREAWDAACRELGAELAWTLRRANLLVEGVALAETVGRRLNVGAVKLEVCEENPPCRVMDAQHAGLRAVLAPEWRAGVACRVLEGGRGGLSDAVWWDPA
jgi:hypothetical protein